MLGPQQVADVRARPGKWRRRIGWTLVTILGLLVIAFLILRTPDTDRAAMIAQYGGGESRFLTLTSGATVHIRDTGGSEGQPQMILLHGSNASLHTWEPLVARLRNDWRIVRIDLPGHGLTGATPTGRYDTEEYIATVDEVATAMGMRQFILGGNSMGGGVSWRYALAHPERVQALLLLDAGGMPPRAEDPAPQSNIGFRIIRNPVGRWLGTHISPRSLFESSLRQSVSNKSIVTDAAIDRYWELNRFPGNRQATMIRFARGFGDPAIAERARQIQQPVLILFGDEDRIINPSAAQSFAERLPNDEVVMLPGIGHLPMEEAPDATARAIRRFLGARGLGPRVLSEADAARGTASGDEL
jgi:pimeloyl-ACP methyl ester carboxylesterase